MGLCCGMELERRYCLSRRSKFCVVGLSEFGYSLVGGGNQSLGGEKTLQARSAISFP
jgi:hypothetical protein